MPFPYLDASTLAHTVLRAGTPPAAIIPGLQSVRRSSVSTVGALTEVAALVLSTFSAIAANGKSITQASGAWMSASRPAPAKKRLHI